MINTTSNTQTQQFRVETLTPTHVGGAGENHWQRGIDFIVRNNKTWLLDFQKLVKEIDLSQLSLAFSKDSKSPSLDKLLEQKDISILSSKNFLFNAGTNPDIKRHIFNGFDGKPYLPGSSIKGSVRSILLNYFYKQTRSRGDINIKNLIGDFENSIMRFFQFSDVSFESTFLTFTKIFNLQKNNGTNWEGGWKHGSNDTTQVFNNGRFTTIYECIQIKSTANLTISFKQKAVEALYKAALINEKIKTPPSHTAGWLTSFDFEILCQIINNHTLQMLNKEIRFFEKYQFDNDTSGYVEELKEIKGKVLNTDSSQSCVLRLAAGSGFHSITGDWQYDSYIETGEKNGKRKYKSRKLAFESDSKGNRRFQPMGFVKLTMQTEEEIAKLEAEKQVIIAAAQAEEQRKVETARIAAEEARLKAEQDSEAARIAAEEAKKPKLYEGSISKNLEVDAEVMVSGKPNRVKIYVKGFEERQFEMNDSAQQPKGYVCRVALVVEKGKVLRVRHIRPK